MTLAPNDLSEDTDEDEYVVTVTVTVRNQELAFHALERMTRVGASLVFDGADRSHTLMTRASEFSEDDDD